MQERREFSTEFKAWVVLDLIPVKKGRMEASREYQAKDMMLSHRKQEFLE